MAMGGMQTKLTLHLAHCGVLSMECIPQCWAGLPQDLTVLHPDEGIHTTQIWCPDKELLEEEPGRGSAFN